MSSRNLNPRDMTLERLADRTLLERDDSPLVLAVSGGPDSMALLHFILASASGRRVIAAHVNHGLRGAASDADAAFVTAQAAAWGVEGIVVEAVLPQRARARVAAGAAEEAAARRARYAALRGIAERAGADRIVTAHTADDQAETILLRLVRGAGLRGIGGMRPLARVHGIQIARALLGVGRAEVLDYIDRHAIPYRLDATNDLTAAARNYVRHEIVPRFEARLNPAVREALLRSAAGFREADSFLEGRARRAFPGLVLERSEGKTALDARKLVLYPKLLQSYIFRRAIRELRGNLRDLSSVHIQALHDLVASQSGHTTFLPGHITVRRDRDRVTLSLEPKAVGSHPSVEA